MIEAIFVPIFLTGLILAWYFEYKNSLIPNWISYGLIGFAIILRGIFSVIYQDTSFILEGLFGLFIAFIVGSILFHTGIGRGGSLKLIVTAGATFGFALNLDHIGTIIFINFPLVWGGLLVTRPLIDRFILKRKWLFPTEHVRTHVVIILALPTVLSFLFNSTYKYVLLALTVLAFIFLSFRKSEEIFGTYVKPKTIPNKNLNDKNEEWEEVCEIGLKKGKKIFFKIDSDHKKNYKKLMKYHKEGKLKYFKIWYSMNGITSLLIWIIVSVVFKNLFLF